jgi:hypothetical protein
MKYEKINFYTRIKTMYLENKYGNKNNENE